MSNERELSRTKTMARQTLNRFLFLVLLTNVLVALKLTGFIDCGWIWVLAPALLPVAFCGLIILVSGLYEDG